MEKKEFKIEENRFHAVRHEIAEIDEPIDIGAMMVAKAHGWDCTDTGEAQEDYDAFIHYCWELQRKSSIHNNLVAAYFLGE